MKRTLISFLIALVTVCLDAQEADSALFVHRVGFDVRPAFLSQHHDFFRGSNSIGKPMRASVSEHLRYSFMFPMSSRLGELYPTAYQGVGVASYSFFNHRELGTPTAVYVFQGARIASFGHGLSLDYEWNFGASFGWHPFSAPDKDGNGGNPLNTVTGTKTNAFIDLALMLSWNPVPEWTVSAGVDFSHFSNGDTSFPNAGVNSTGMRVGAVRSFGGIPMAGRCGMDRGGLKGQPFMERISLDVIAFGAWNSENVTHGDVEYMVEGKFAVAGFHLNPLYRIAAFLRIGASVDIQFNEGVNLPSYVAGADSENGTIRFHRPPLRDQLAAGVSLRAELQMPVFSVNLGVGHNIIYKGEELGGIYNFAVLKAFLTKSLFAHVGLKMCYTEASNNLMIGLGWRFGNNA